MHCSYQWPRLFPMSTKMWGFFLDITSSCCSGGSVVAVVPSVVDVFKFSLTFYLFAAYEYVVLKTCLLLMNRHSWKRVYIFRVNAYRRRRDGQEAGVPGGGGAVADITDYNPKCIGEALWRLPMDYDVSVKGSDAPADRSSPRTQPMRLSPPPCSVWFS
jgi:hypothetical protein